MLTTKENVVEIEGILSEIDIQYGSFKKNGADVKSIGGVIKVRVNQEINKVPTELEVPVHLFASQYTNAGAVNPAFTSIEKVMNTYTSIAASDIDSADRVRLKGSIQMNEYYGQDGKLKSFPRISASFVSKINKEDCKPDASFSVILFVGNKGFETDADGVETNKYKVTGIIPQYGGKADVVPFIAVNKGVIDGISNYWNTGDTVKASGKLNFTSKTEVQTIEVDFGEPQQKTRTISVSELIITGGSQSPLEGDFAINGDDIQAALEERKTRLATLKDKASGKAAPAKTAPTASSFAAYGF